MPDPIVPEGPSAVRTGAGEPKEITGGKVEKQEHVRTAVWRRWSPSSRQAESIRLEGGSGKGTPLIKSRGNEELRNAGIPFGLTVLGRTLLNGNRLKSPDEH